MEQSVIIKDVTLANIVATAEKTLGRKLEAMELAILEFGIEQVRLGVANV